MWSNTFSAWPVMIHAWLAIFRWVNCVPFTIGNLISRFQMIELPSHKWIIEWICIGCDESSTPINLFVRECGNKCIGTVVFCVKKAFSDSNETYVCAKCFHILNSQWWKIFKPMCWIGEFLDFFVRKTQTLHDLPLIFSWTSLCNGFTLLYHRKHIHLLIQFNIFEMTLPFSLCFYLLE